MNIVVEQHIVDTLDRMRNELADNGVSEVASDLWSHALWMYRKYKLAGDRRTEDSQFLDIPSFLRRQAD